MKTFDPTITTTRTQPNVVKVDQGIFRSYLTADDVAYYLNLIARPASPGFIRHEGLILDESQLLSLRAVLAAEWVA